jgi:hypothetical protein
MDATEMLKYAINLCDAVDYAHKRNLIHRDIKPANLMLDVQGQAILMDFGIAKILGGQYHTATGATIGTALYMAPEQIKGERVDEGADIYSIGVTLFEMVSGRPPFEADSAMTTMMMHLNDPVPDLRQIQPGTPPELVAIIEKSLAKNRNQRYASAAEMSTALSKILDRMYTAAAGATLVSEGMPPETTLPAEPLDATLKAPGAGQVSPVPVAARPIESQPAPAEATFKAAGVAVAAGAVASAEPAVGAAAGQAPTILTPAGSEPPPPPPVATPQPTSAAGEPPKKRAFSPAMLAGGAATILILLVIIFVAGQNLLGGNNEPPATEPAATLPALAQETAVLTNTPPPTSIPPTYTPPPTATTKPYATPTTAPTPTDTPSTEPYVEITGITVLKDNYGTPTNFLIDYKTENFTEGRTGLFHIHFFFNTVPPDQAGNPANGPWELYYGPSPFKPTNQMKLQNRPAQATQICALVANQDHTLYYPASGELTTGNCWNIPPY